MTKSIPLIVGFAVALAASSVYAANLEHFGWFYDGCKQKADDPNAPVLLPNGETEGTFYCDCVIDEMGPKLTDQEWAAGQLLAALRPNDPAVQPFLKAAREAAKVCLNRVLKAEGKRQLTPQQLDNVTSDLPF
jgi:hypothetical protein